MTPPATPSSFNGTVHLVFSSHWDREWYLPFQKFRARLVEMLDVVLAELASGRLSVYQMDGQFIPLEDYLQIRPERQTQLRELVRTGRLRVGPWYNLPDEFLVSGESLVRNFALGMARAEAFGQTSRVGWLCDLFGHNSQMPQVLRGFGITGAILWRGVDPSLGPIFQWRSPDGSRVLTHAFPRDGYSDFDFQVRGANDPHTPLSEADLRDRARRYLDDPVLATASRHRLWFDGGDHMDYDPRLPAVGAALNRELGSERIRVSTLDDYLTAVEAEALPNLPTWTGEFREACSMETHGWLIPGVGSSRIPLKQANHSAETLLTLWSEPWCATASARLGMEYPARSLELAWEYLLKNHPHDSICGCSPDETHDAMPYRFQQCRQLAEAHLERAHTAISRLGLHPLLEPGEVGISLFAPVGGARQECPEVTIKLPANWPQFNEFFGFETKPAFRVFSEEGKEIEYQLLEVIPTTTHVQVPTFKFPAVEKRQGVRLALGVALEPGEDRHLRVVPASGPVRLPQADRLGIGRDRLQNEFLEVVAHSDGTLTLTDRSTGRTFGGLLALEDTADIGDGWFHGVALQDTGFLSTGGQVSFGLMENGPLLARLKIRVEWLVPAEFDFATNHRSDRLVPLVVEHRVTLRRGQRHVEIRTTVQNTVRDHRLRLLCPTHFDELKTFWADSPFDAVERLVKLPANNHQLRELAVEMSAQQNWVAGHDGSQGLALLAPGQYESAVLDQPDHPICLTLLRGFRRAVFTDGNEGGQILGNHVFHCALQPFVGPEVPLVDLFQTAQAIAAPVRAVFADQAVLAREFVPAIAATSDLPSLAGAVVTSARYQSAPGEWTFRVFNPAMQPTAIRLLGSAKWTQTNLRGEDSRAIEGSEFTVAPKQIFTLTARI